MWLEFLNNREVNLPQVCEHAYVEVKKGKPEAQGSETDYFGQKLEALSHWKAKSRKKMASLKRREHIKEERGEGGNGEQAQGIGGGRSHVSPL